MERREIIVDRVTYRVLWDLIPDSSKIFVFVFVRNEQSFAENVFPRSSSALVPHFGRKQGSRGSPLSN